VSTAFVIHIAAQDA